MEQRRDLGPQDRPARTFPGGKVRLPRLNVDRSSGPQIDMVDTAFLGGGTTAIEQEAPTGFTGYFTYESLFEEPADSSEGGTDDPYTVLRVDPTADWATIVTAHRLLAKEFHPDRFVDHPAEVVAQAEIEIKRINGAYAELRKLHAGSGDRRSGSGDRRSSPR